MTKLSKIRDRVWTAVIILLGILIAVIALWLGISIGATTGSTVVSAKSYDLVHVAKANSSDDEIQVVYKNSNKKKMSKNIKKCKQRYTNDETKGNRFVINKNEFLGIPLQDSYEIILYNN